jgi:exopolysaccharide biosynthesis polyprenyl glycosylphosphotransferase
MGLFLACVWLLLTLAHANAKHFLGWARQEFGTTHFVALVGSAERTRRIHAILDRSLERTVSVVAALDQETAASAIAGLLHRQIVDEVIFAVDPKDLALMEDLFLLCEEEGVRTRVAVDLFPHLNSDVFLDRLGPLPLLTFSSAPHDEIRLLVKRLADLLVSIVALPVLLPLLAGIGILVRLTSPGPAIFRQIRCGLNGRRFVCYKFRSMVADAEERRASLEHLNEKQTAFKITNDPRLTPLGRWLRKFSLDELPQFWNVLRGDMSLVGPRPAIPAEVDRYERWQRRRLRMRPGLTCLWALNGRDHLDFESWMKMDLQYIDNWSLTLDLKILVKTVPQVVLGRGAN